MQSWLNTHEGNSFMKDAKSRRISSLHLICLLTIFALLQSVSAQSLDIATRLTPWPPPGWPEGAQGEVRLVAQGDGGQSEATGIVFPIGEAGEVTYRFPEALPRRADRFYRPVDMEEYAVCPEVSPTLSPPDGEVALIGFEVYANGEAWGVVEMTLEQEELFSISGESVLAVLYARAPIRIGGGGICPAADALGDASEVVYDLSLEEGPNVAVMAYEASFSGIISMTLTTRESLELPGTPVRYSQ